MSHFLTYPTHSFGKIASGKEFGVHLAGAFCLNDLRPKTRGWLWPGRIPLGCVTLLVGNPGTGKSLVALDIAARLSTARPMPGANDQTRMTNDQMPTHSSFDIRHSSITPKPQSASSVSTTAHNPNSPLPTTSTTNNESQTSNPEPTTHPSSDIRHSSLNPHSSPTPNSPSSVIILTVEDHFASTVRPRLQSLGADCTRIFGLAHAPGNNIRTIYPPAAIKRDIDRLEILLRDVTNCRLIILDPITAFFGDTSSNSTGNIWKSLANLSGLAASANVAVLAISHTRKKEGAAIHGPIGSVSYIAAARAAWTVSADPAEPSRRLFLPLKNNLAECAKGLAFNIQSAADGGPLVRWLPEPIDVGPSAADSCRLPGRPNDERQFAIEWLRRELSNGQLPMQQVRQAAEAHGITWGTLRRAFRDLGAQAIFNRNDRHIRWDWKLPVIERKTPGESCAHL